MRVSRRAGAGIVLFCLALAVLASCAIAQQKASARYDGHWWLSISDSERFGFLNGYFDCYHYEFKGPAEFSKWPLSLPQGVPIPNPDLFAQGRITSFYKAHPQSLDLPVPEVLYRFRDRPGEERQDDDGEPIKGPHGGNDGSYWNLISAQGGPEVKQLGFVEGYLWCHEHLSRNKGGVFSKPPAEYVRLITQWYGYVAETGDINPEREPTAIADALFKFRDRPQGAPPQRK